MSPDRFDPLMDLNTAKSKGDFSAPPLPADTGSSPLAQPFDGAANFGTTGADIMIGADGRPIAANGIERQPADVQRFNGGTV